MSNIDLQIGGRRFTVSCTPGEEAHITGLGRMIDSRLAKMGSTAGTGETRMLLFAALLLADELHDVKQGKAPPAPPPPPPIDPVWAEKLEGIADSLEKCALHLESEAPYA